MTIDSAKYYTVGEIVNTHGLRGEVRVWPRTDFPEERFGKGSLLHMEENGELVMLEVAAARKHKNVYVVKFKQYDHINQVERLKGTLVKVSGEQQTPLDDHEFYFHEIIGCEVFEQSGKHLGTITEILQPGANDVWVCKRADGTE